jgi:hypothetical protein
MSPSYIVLPDTAPHSLWPLFAPDDHSMFVVPPPEPRRPTLSPAEHDNTHAALLASADYVHASLDAFDAGDVADLLHNLCVLRSIAAVVADRLGTLQ